MSCIHFYLLSNIGIGPFVNPTFLKTLSGVGRGHNYICLHPSLLEVSILELMNKATGPLLMDLSLNIVHGNDIAVEVYPFPIPDLYAGCPVAIAGAWSGSGMFPPEITISGRLPDGQRLNINVQCRTTETGYLNKALGSFRIDSIVSSYWMKQASSDDQNKLKQQAIDASIESSIPCVFTQCVAYETKLV